VPWQAVTGRCYSGAAVGVGADRRIGVDSLGPGYDRGGAPGPWNFR
jgi:hypothetical protein